MDQIEIKYCDIIDTDNNMILPSVSVSVLLCEPTFAAKVPNNKRK